MLANIEELNPEQKESVILLIEGKDIVVLLLWMKVGGGVWVSLIYQLAPLVAK